MAEQEEALKSTRRTAQEILAQVKQNGEDELRRSTKALLFSGVAGGMVMGLTGLSVAISKALLGDGRVPDFVAHLFYPVGFISVIIGRSQLFTENTLYAVVPVLDEHKNIANMLRLWGAVFFANVLGAVLFALLLTGTPALMPNFSEELLKLGLEAIGSSASNIFWSGVIGGWLIALVAWIVSASHWTIGQIVIVWLLTFIVGIGRFAHCIATSGEILAGVVNGIVPVMTYLHWLLFATLGNILGGVFIVTVLNYGQVVAGEHGP